jgi:predicted nucleotidyltransferase
MNSGLSTDTIHKIIGVFKKYEEIQRVFLYGSRARGCYKNGSDIDMTLSGPELNLTILQKVENALDDLMLPYKIDISILEEIDNEALLEHIQKEGEILYQKN